VLINTFGSGSVSARFSGKIPNKAQNRLPSGHPVLFL
ncbi:uncharacterized protein METZ01_LOCUS180392, partial [marine metagenome]